MKCLRIVDRFRLGTRGAYITQTLRVDFNVDLDHDLEVPVCVFNEPDGTIRASVEPPPERPEDEPGRTVERGIVENLVLSGEMLFPPNLPENPTAEERWRYLLEILKQRGRVN